MQLLPLSGLSKPAQWVLVVSAALALSLLTFAGSFAGAPNSQYLPSVVAAR